MNKRFQSPIVLLGARFLSPYIFMFGLYVIFHGHYSPGGGFQGGALLAAAILLVRVAGGEKIGQLQLIEKLTTPIGVIGVIIYFGTGLSAILAGGNFLDYGVLPFPGVVEPAWSRYIGLLIIEVGIGAAVMAILVMIYDNMIKGEDYD
ncbi:MAG TPA: sodium:proton antiporter [Bacteroidetes bacterium]|nr:sodium:proton antiporter [Bacteroidota bacterium]